MKLRHMLSRLVPAKPHILIACMPKSASSFLTDSVAALPRMMRAKLVPGYGGREQEFDTAFLAKHALRGYVSQQHIRFSEPTDRLMHRFAITPVVLTRNLFDAVASFRDHVRSESAIQPMANLTPEQVSLPDAELEELIAHLVMPWYVNFFVSWQSCDRALRVSYEDVRTRPSEVLMLIAEHAKMSVSRDDIYKSIALCRQRPKRMNKGVAGRGRTISLAAQRHIERLVSHYPDVDFSTVGLTAHKPQSAA